MFLENKIELACLLEATARKPGNVHPAAHFSDLSYADFQRAAAVASPILAHSRRLGIGASVEAAVSATRDCCATNVNLGICLLLAPIAAAPDAVLLRQGVREVVRATTQTDAVAVYAAIRAAVAGGLGEVREQDISDTPTISLREAMQLAEDRDAIAREWATDFRGIDRDGAGWLREDWNNFHQLMKNRPDDELPLRFLPWEAAIIHTHLRYIAQGDTLIRRKCGDAIFHESRRRAEDVLKAGGCRTVTGQQELTQFDAWLRADGHRRNPGTSADLVAASLFWCLRKNWIVSPTKDDLLLHAEAIRSASCPALQSGQ